MILRSLLTRISIVWSLAVLCASPMLSQQQNSNVNNKNSPPSTAVTNRNDAMYQRADILSVPAPKYTAEAQEKIIEGKVTLQIALMPDGTIGEIKVLQSLRGGLTDQAIATARGIKFRPAQRNGKAVGQWVQLDFDFKHFLEADSPLIERQPKIIELPSPEYSAEARWKKFAGKARVKVMLHREGQVEVLEVLDTLPYNLKDKAIAAAQKIKFEPAQMKSGKPVSVSQTIEIEFKLP